MILVVDDDRSITASLSLLLKQSGYKSMSVAAPAEALGQLDRQDLHLVLQDMNFSRQTTGEEGLALLKQIKSRRPELPVILITAWGTIELAVHGMRAGAADFVTKPWTQQQIVQSVQTALSLAATAPQAAAQPRTRAEYDARHDFAKIIGEDPKILKILEIISRVSATDASVLITGESGTGKELVAEVIHRNSHRRHGPFVKVNLGGVSTSLFESEMFGHVKGAFTDARSDRKGRFEVADGGTIFLDEIGELDPGVQVKLLRVLQDRTYEVLGSSLPRTVNVRVISATNRNLPGLVEEGRFREDLLFRLNLIAIQIPPLRERPGDIPALVNHFLERLSRSYGRGAIRVTSGGLDWLRWLSWPGNIRQLAHLIERTVLTCDKELLDAVDFRLALDMELREADRSLPEVGSISLDEMEKAMILKALKHHRGHITNAAASLGLSRTALYRRMEKYGIKA
ncbi:MAG: sigma-54 dependent transcriptional regulator [Acidobacteriota bacterium]